MPGVVIIGSGFDRVTAGRRFILQAVDISGQRGFNMLKDRSAT
jgi:hypothetical protein